MKTLEMKKLENIEGGGFVEGACAVLAFADAGAAMGAFFGSLVLPVWGTAALIGGSLACLAYELW